ncbi:unnamed protein product [Linum trigynum]|uniref:Uncharacterized protein n=1 Tax=Linum trigynum TaxID=586398 RepID=A0AAV2FAU2_9ROSI
MAWGSLTRCGSTRILMEERMERGGDKRQMVEEERGNVAGPRRIVLALLVASSQRRQGSAVELMKSGEEAGKRMLGSVGNTDDRKQAQRDHGNKAVVRSKESGATRGVHDD